MHPPAPTHRMRRYPSSVRPSSCCTTLLLLLLLLEPPAPATTARGAALSALLGDMEAARLALPATVPASATSSVLPAGIGLLLRLGASRKRPTACPANSSMQADARSGSSEGALPPPSSGARASAPAPKLPTSWPKVAPAPSSPNKRPAAFGENTSAERAHRL